MCDELFGFMPRHLKGLGFERDYTATDPNGNRTPRTWWQTEEDVVVCDNFGTVWRHPKEGMAYAMKDLAETYCYALVAAA